MRTSPVLAGSQQMYHDSQPFTDPKNLRVLVVDSKGSSRQAVSTVLKDCGYQVTAVKTAREGLQLLGHHTVDASPPFDLVLKEHEPPAANACRLLRKLAKNELLRHMPVVVMSSQDERDIVMNCLSLGAIDYLVKPLRQNELRHIWTRIWWWRRTSSPNVALTVPPKSSVFGPFSRMSQAGSSDSKETKCDEEDEPTSKEGSAPGGNGHESSGNGHGSNGNGSKEGNGTSRVEAKPHCNGNNNGNGSSDNKNGTGNSATKNGHGSNGNGASTTLVPERPGSCALVNTAEGKISGAADTPGTKAGSKSSAFAHYVVPSTSSRKRPSSDTAQLASNREDESQQQMFDQSRAKSVVHRDRLQIRSTPSVERSTPSTRSISEDTIHPSQQRQSNLHKGAPGSEFPAGAPTLSGAPHYPLSGNLQHGMSHLAGWPGSQHPHLQIPVCQAQALPSGQLPHAFPSHFMPPYGLPAQMLPQQLHPFAAMYGPAGAQTAHAGTAPVEYYTVEQIMAAAAAADPANLAHQQRAAHPHCHHPGHHPLHPHESAALANAGNPQLNSLGYAIFQAYSNYASNQQQLHQPSHQPPIHAQQLHQPAIPNLVQPLPHQPQPHSHLTMQPGWHPQPTVAGGWPASVPRNSNVIAGDSNVSGGTGAATNNASGVRNHSHVGSGVYEPHRRRALALDKYRAKRKNLKFSKTIRYETRKQLAIARPRIKGQFVKHSKTGQEQDGDGETNTNGQSPNARYWQNPEGHVEEQNQNYEDEEFEEEEYDQDEEDDIDDDMEDNADEEHEKGVEEVPEEEADVVNSLRELRDGPPRSSQQVVEQDSSKACSLGSAGRQSSLGSQSGQVSRGSHGAGQTSHSRSLSHGYAHALAAVRPAPPPPRSPEARLSDHVREVPQRMGSSHHHAGHDGKAGANGKNSSDSGSNSPDDNGNGRLVKHAY